MKLKKLNNKVDYDDDVKPKKKLAKLSKSKNKDKPEKVKKKGKTKEKLSKKVVKEKGKKKTKEKKVMKFDVKPIKQKQNKSQLIQHIMEEADIISILPKKMQDNLSERHEKKIVTSVMGALEKTMLAHVVKGGSGNFMFPTMFKIVTKKTPAKPARKGRNPFTGEEMMFKAKPASIKVRIRPMRKLKDAALN